MEKATIILPDAILKPEHAVRASVALLGHNARDKVTGFSGVVTSISLDLYGCAQATVDAGFIGDKKERVAHWFDVNRLEVTSTERVMELPEYLAALDVPAGAVDHGRGPAEKPSAGR